MSLLIQARVIPKEYIIMESKNLKSCLIRAVSAVSLAALISNAACAETKIASPGQVSSSLWPTTLSLPTGQRPEGIAIKGTQAFVTSYVDGTIFRFDLRTGQRTVLTKGSGQGAIGILLDNNGRLFIAGGMGGDLRVIDSNTGNVLKKYRLAKDLRKTAVNDLTILNGNLYVTDSFAPVIYKVPLPSDGQLPDQRDIKIIPLDGVKYAGEGDQGWNANGITPTPDGKALLLVQTNTGILYRVDPENGKSTPVDIQGADLSWSDGMRLEGQTLYVVRNTSNKLIVLHINQDGSKGKLLSETADPRFDTPTTLARFGERLYLTNARFYSKDPKNTEYVITAIPDPEI
ncbi:SMP-30/gluconolactonase/LRE family protein [Serratia fonticola]|nr:hypothetical protein [Serratia fonticola]